MSSIQSNCIIKKNNTLGIKPLKKSIQINININSSPRKFLFSNNVNKIASSYLSMGRKIQINKSRKNSKILKINTVSNSNYYTINNKEANQTNYSITNTLNNNTKVNKTNIYINNPKSQTLLNDIKSRYNKKPNFSKPRISNESLINTFQYKKRISKKNEKILDSKDKNKKVPMKSKIRQYKFQNKNNKSVSSTSFNNTYMTKIKLVKDINNNNNILTSNLNFFDKNNHLRNNTTNFKNKEIDNIFNNKTIPNNNRSNKFNNRNEYKSSLNNIKINNSINLRAKIKVLNEEKKNDYNKNAKKMVLNKKENNSNSINNNIKKHHKFYYSKYLTSKINDNAINNNYNTIHHIKNYVLDNINIKEKEKINKINKAKFSTIQCKKILPNGSIEINLNKIVKNEKNIQVNEENENNKLIKKNIDYSLFKINDTLSKKLFKNNEEGHNINLCDKKEINNRKNKLISYIKIDDNEKKSDNSYNLNNDLFKNINKNDYNEYNKHSIIDMNKTFFENIKKNNDNKNNYKKSIIINENKNEEILKKDNLKNKSNNSTKNTIIYLNSQNIKDFKSVKNIPIILNKTNNILEHKKKLINHRINNTLFDEENLDELPNNYDEKFNDLYSIRNKINYNNVIVTAKSIFTEEGTAYNKYKDNFDKIYDKLFIKKRSLTNSGYKTKKNMEVTSNSKTNYSSSSKKYSFNLNFVYKN